MDRAVDARYTSVFAYLLVSKKAVDASPPQPTGNLPVYKSAASRPQAAEMSWPRDLRMKVGMPASINTF